MKPKIFIGSSVEGLNVAYAIQQNLTHDGESTVWDQGVFDLSKTTIESLDETLEKMDFGVFVFSGDDITIMREDPKASVRDNVLFELGLFIGKLGRERVFFVIPDGSSIHIPTDLLGVTPGKYESNRTDGSLQSATGVVCNQIREKIKSLGVLRERVESEESDEKGIDESNLEGDWFSDFMNDDFQSAKNKLKKGISGKSGDEKLRDEAWVFYMNLKLNLKNAVEELCGLVEKNKGNIEIEKLVPNMLCWEDFNNKAIDVAIKSYLSSDENVELAVVLADCYDNNGNTDKALEILERHDPGLNPTVAIALANLYKEGDAERLQILRESYENNSNHERLVYCFARELLDHEEQKEALYLLDFLTANYSKKADYWGFLSNTCVSLGLYDKGMFACKKAEELTSSKSAWILHNIGNMLNTKGFHSEAISWLKKGLELDPESQYAHDRLSKAIISKEDQLDKYNELKKEGKNRLRTYEPVFIAVKT